MSPACHRSAMISGRVGRALPGSPFALLAVIASAASVTFSLAMMFRDSIKAITATDGQPSLFHRRINMTILAVIPHVDLESTRPSMITVPLELKLLNAIV